MTVMCVLLFVLDVSMLTECEGARVMPMLVWGTWKMWLQGVRSMTMLVIQSEGCTKKQCMKT